VRPPFPHLHLHAHVAARRVLAALAVTVAAAAVELTASRSGHSLFLVADALHLMAHVGIFAVLLLPIGPRHERREDTSTILVLVLVLVIAGGIAWESLRRLAEPSPAEVQPAWMAVSIVGLGANLLAAWLFRDPARHRFSFRAALAHELADASLTIAGLAGAVAIHFLGVRWIDPALSLAIVAWLAGWALWLLARRARGGPGAWAGNRTKAPGG
jgi:cobalt-zinc-cadmium efflux system protein